MSIKGRTTEEKETKVEIKSRGNSQRKGDQELMRGWNK